MQQLTISKETFNEMLVGFIKNGVTFEAEENKQGFIVVTFTGGY